MNHVARMRYLTQPVVPVNNMYTLTLTTYYSSLSVAPPSKKAKNNETCHAIHNSFYL